MYLKWTLAALPALALAWLTERPDWSAAIRQWRKLVPLSILGIGGYSALLYLALVTTTPFKAVLILAFCPVLILLISAVVLRESLALLKVAGISLSVIGVLWVLTAGNLSQLLSLHFVPGDLIMIAAIICLAAYTILLKKAPEVPPITSSALQITITVILMTPYAVIHGVQLPQTSSTQWSLAYIALFPAVASYALWNFGSKFVEPGRAGITFNLKTVFVPLITIGMGGTISSSEITGGALILIGVFLAVHMKKSSHRDELADPSVDSNNAMPSRIATADKH